MGTLTGRDVHIDVPLSEIVIAYRPHNFIADKLAPIIQVGKQSDGFLIWSIEDAFRREDARRAPGDEANVITRGVSSDTYFAHNYALKDKIPYEDLKNKDAAYTFLERQGRAEYVTDRLFLDWEFRVASQVTSTSNVGSSSNVSSAWTDLANSTPFNDVDTALNNVEDATGYRPNRIVFSSTAWRNYKNNAGVISRVFGTTLSGSARVVMKSNVAALHEVDEVLVGGGHINTADENQALAMSQIWGDNVLCYYAPMAPRRDVPSFMYSFRWNQVMNMEARVYDLPRKKAEEVEVGFYQDEKVTGKSLSFLITNTNSSS